MRKTEPTDPILACLGCDITREDIARLKLDVRFIGPGAPCLEGTDQLLPICSRCIGDPESLTRALAKEIKREEIGRWKVIAALLTLRDKALFQNFDEHLAKFRRLAPVMQGFCSQMDERLTRIEHHLGLDVDAKPAEEQRAKNGIMGALAGAFIGAIVGSAAKPLEALKAVIDKGHGLVEDALRQKRASTGE